MITKEQIEEVKKRLIEVYDPLEIYIFGSHAWGHPTEDSDLDILVVVKEAYADRHSMLVDGHRVLSDVRIPKDILVYTKQEFDQCASDVTKLSYKIVKEGKKIYARA